MATNISLLNSNNTNNINTNFQRVATALANTVGRDGTLPNQMNAELDLNSNDILNVNRIDIQELYMDGSPVISIPNMEEIIALAEEIVEVAAISDEVVVVADNIASVNSAATNMAAIIAAPAAASAAASSAAAAAASAAILGDGDKGDIVVSGSGSVWTIDPSTISLVKLDAAMVAAVPTLSKPSYLSSAFTRTGVGTATIKSGTVVKVGTTLVRFTSDTAITMPTLTAGTDYAVFVSSAGAVQAVAWTANTGTDPTPPGGTWTWVGGFHYAPGSNATGYNTGGNRTPQINEYSFWDLRFRPKCPDPRGMTLVANKFWADVYFLGVDHHTGGTSRHGVNIATGGVLPKLPTMFGGNGVTLVTQLDWFWSAEILDSHAKRYMDHTEFRTAAFGVIEEAAGGRANAAVQTGINFNNNGGGTNNDERYTSMWGMNLSIANHYIWGQNLIGHNYTGAYTPPPGVQTAPQINPGYYQDYNGRVRGYSPQLDAQYARGALFGGSVGSNAIGRSGSGSIDWANAVSSFSASISVRGAADHLISI